MMKDQRDLLLAFNAQNVKYLIVGGHAYSHYTEPRATKDLDILIDTSRENAQRVFVALAHFGAPLENITVEDMQDITHGHQVGIDPDRVDILKSIDGVDFESAWQSGEAGIIDSDIPVRYISFEDLIKNKLAVGRLRDLADVEDLRKSAAANGDTPSPSEK